MVACGREARCVALVGMPWSGKSTVGRAAALAAGVPFTDTDDMIAARLGGPFAPLAARDPDGFRRLEEDTVLRVPRHRGVVATGGSAVYGERAMAHLAAIGEVVYLDVPIGELRRRAGDAAARGVVMPPGWTLDDLHAERDPLYRRWAARTVRAGSVAEAAALVAAALAR